jgi:Lysozyme like domain
MQGTVKKLRDRQRELRNEINSLRSKAVDVSVKFKLSPAPGSSFGTFGPSGDGSGIGRAVRSSVGTLAQSALGVGALTIGAGGLDGADFDLGPFAAIAAGMGGRVTSGLRPGAVTSTGNPSYHATGDAIDVGGPLGVLRRFAATMKAMFGPRLRELISPWPELGIKDGRPFRYSQAIQADHSGPNAHVHVAYTGPFGDGIGQAAAAGRDAGWRGSDLVTAVAIAGPESRYRLRARNNNPPVEDSWGPWQINLLAHPWARGMVGTWAGNARAAHRIWRKAGGFRPWAAFTSGDYRSWVPRARDAVIGSRSSRGGGGGGGGGGGKPEFNPGSGSAGPAGPMTLAGSGDTGGGPGQGGGGGGGGYEVQLGRVGVDKAQAQARDDNPAMVRALQKERRIKKRRLRKINRTLRRRIKKATRARLLGEKAQLITEIAEIADLIREYSGKGVIGDDGGGADGGAAGGDGGAAGDGDAPTAADFIDADLALAGLTPGSEDDLAALRALEDLREDELAAALATPDPRDDIEAANNLKSVRDAIEQLTETIAEANRLQEQRDEIAREQLANQQAILRLAGQGDQIIAAIWAALDGDIGQRLGLALQTPGYGGDVGRYSMGGT